MRFQGISKDCKSTCSYLNKFQFYHISKNLMEFQKDVKGFVKGFQNEILSNSSELSKIS